jgi:methylmalonyl-CoA carboxyltransferase 1.3S subunit
VILKLQIGVDGKTYEVDVEVLEDDSTARTPGYLPPQPVTPVTIPSVPVASAPKPAAPAEGNVDEAKVCRSPVAGVALSVSAQPGQTLEANDLMIVLEAMKMETNVTSPIAGKVKSVNVKAGDAVKVNQILVEFE